MKTIYGFSRIKRLKSPVVTLGVFDGVHYAHRRIIRAAVVKAKETKGTSVVVTFWPHPKKKESLYSLAHRLKLIEEMGVDYAVVINFTKSFSGISPENFIKDFLVKRLKPEYVFIGKNFKFGKRAKGDFRVLAKLAQAYNFKLKVFDFLKLNKYFVSSTSIRSLIRAGDLNAAQLLLGRRVSILGRVIKGESLGRKLGFPTANIDPHHEVVPPSGIYSAEVILDGKKHQGICYIGTKPTLKSQIANRKSQNPLFIETHIFNFHKNIYGKVMEIQFIRKLREDIKFSSPAALAAQIKKDITSAKKHFSR